MIRRVLRRWPRRRTALALVGLAALAVLLTWHGYRRGVGDPREAMGERWFEGHRIVDREGVLLRELPSALGHRGRTLPLAAIGDRLVLATLAAEDQAFYDHDGLDRVAMLRALEQNLRHGRLVSGASTITQQLVKLVDTRGIPGPRTVDVKLREAARAQNLERALDKDAILAAYFDRLPYGRGFTGPEAAAQGYFGKRSRDLSWAQATFLAVLPRAPSYLDPYDHRERVIKRQHAVLGELRAAGVIGEREHERVLAEPIELRPRARPFEAPHFMQMLVDEDRLADGPMTRTTLDAALQRDVEGLVRTHMAGMARRAATGAAVLVVDNATGDVLAYVGSVDFHDPEAAGQVDMVRARRQPGSTLKPFVYALAFTHGHTPHELVADVPTEFAERGGRVYAPKNFHDEFVGPISAREALAASLNVPVVRLAATLEQGELLAFLQTFGFDSLAADAEHYGLALALGSGEVGMRELAAAYVALARGGTAVALRVVDSDPAPAPRRVLSASVAAAVTDALADPLARLRLLRGGATPFDIGFPLALKTGTSSGHRDAWTLGFTHERTVAVWLGNANGDAMVDVTGAMGAGPLFADVMRRAMRDVATRLPLFDPELLETVAVCPLSGLLAGPACPHAVERRFVPEHLPHEPCTLHRHARREGDGGFTCAKQGGETIAVLPSAFDRFLEGLPRGAPGRSPQGIPWLRARDVTGCDEDEGARPLLTIESPAEGAVYWLAHDGRDRDRVELRARYDGPRDQEPDAVEFVVDGRVVARSRHPFTALVDLGPGDHELHVRPGAAHAAVGLGRSRFAVR